MTQSAFSGKDATVHNALGALDVEVCGWAFRPSVGAEKHVSDKTAGHNVAVEGPGDFDAMVRVKVPKSISGFSVPFNVGDLITCKFFHDSGAPSDYIIAPCMVATGPFEVDCAAGAATEVEYGLAPRGRPVYYGLYWAGSGSSGQ